LHDLLIGPFVEFGFMRRALVGCLAVSTAAPVLGLFLMLRRMSLTADVLAHGILPGVAGASSGGAVRAGAGRGGLLPAGRGGGRRGPVPRDRRAGRRGAGGALPRALALGVALVSWRGGAVELTQLLFGSALGVDDAALLLMAGSTTLTLGALALAWRPLVLECFDPGFAAAVGARGAWWHLGFLALVVLNLMAAFQALGTLMSVGLMMLPAIAARHWARGVGGMAYAACGIAAAASVAGLLLSFHADVPTGPAVVLCAGLAWVVSVLAGTGGQLGPARPAAAAFGGMRVQPPPATSAKPCTSPEDTSRHPSTSTKKMSFIGKDTGVGRQQHHAEGHEQAGDNHVDHEEWQEHEEADLEGALQLAGQEGGEEHAPRDGLRLGTPGERLRRLAREVLEQGHVGFSHLSRQKGAEGLGRGLEPVHFADPAGHHRLQPLGPTPFEGRLHYEEVRNSARPTSTGLGGMPCAPMAERSRTAP
jgi:zinc/manganese transport system permease protein